MNNVFLNCNPMMSVCGEPPLVDNGAFDPAAVHTTYRICVWYGLKGVVYSCSKLGAYNIRVLYLIGQSCITAQPRQTNPPPHTARACLTRYYASMGTEARSSLLFITYKLSGDSSVPCLRAYSAVMSDACVPQCRASDRILVVMICLTADSKVSGNLKLEGLKYNMLDRARDGPINTYRSRSLCPRNFPPNPTSRFRLSG